MEPRPKLRVLIADDHVLVRDGLSRLIEEQDDLMVVGQTGDAAETLALARSATPDVVLVDVSMPGWGGVRLTEALVSTCPGIKIVGLTRHTDPAIVGKMLAAGASGYVLKQSSFDGLIRGIRVVGSGRRFIDPALGGVDPVQTMAAARPHPAAHDALSPREEQVLRLVADACSNREIAEHLSTDAADVATLKSSAMRKIGLADRVAVMAYARSRGWI